MRTMDMSRRGSVYLKGSFLDMEVVGAGRYNEADLEAASGASSDSGRRIWRSKRTSGTRP
jgi:hypothetical protein